MTRFQTKIFLSLIPMCSNEMRALVIERGLQYLGFASPELFELTKMNSGKLFLLNSMAQKVGISISYARKAKENFSLMGLTSAGELGIDVEYWPKRISDSDFLHTIASDEDAQVLTLFRRSGHDVGIALWAIKEAALKCSGEVMTDPRCLRVSSMTGDIFRVSTSVLATAPLPDVDVRLTILTKNDELESSYIVAIALPKDNYPRKLELISVHLDPEGWQIAPFGEFDPQRLG